MFPGAQVALFAVLTASTVNAFSPIFTTPRQCDSLRITWSSMDTAALSHTEVTMSLIPLDTPSHIVPEPYVLTVPSILEGGEIEVPALPFRAGTQFFASAYIPGNAGPVRRTVSSVLTVEASTDASCLKVHIPEGRSRPKVFGKRQISVVGPNTVDATALTGSASASASATGAPPAINVIGVGVIPSDSAAGSATATDASSTTSSAAAATSTGPVPPIRVIGESQIPATGGGSGDSPANAVPAPASSGGPSPPINVIGTGVVPADGSSASATATESETATATETTVEATSTDVYATETATETSTSCTETVTEAPTSTEDALPAIITTSIEMPGEVQEDSASEETQPCDDATESYGYESTEYSVPSETSSSAHPFNTEVVHYDSFDEMVNAANSMFHAWNPYGPNYTPSP
ncbi:hypothetical protein FRC17_011169 [Serendipita sp. 399]|nr:hypothetical protein FRC17_011169 [Serendipita sp. 399]